VKPEEQAFLAQVALGWFLVKGDGTIWRMIKFTGGGTPSLKRINSTRAERSKSKQDGYPRVLFWHQGKRLKVHAHRIVWMVANKADIPDSMEINHKHEDGDKSRNHPGNLELVTRSENVKHAIHVLGKKRKARPGTENPAARLNEGQVAEIRALWKARAMSQRQIGERFGIKQQTVQNIVNGKTWKHVVLASTG
jgi:DNA-binding transcriptional regulator YiaG